MLTVDTNILRKDRPEVPTEETPHCCYDGWVFLGREGVDPETGELIEVDTERVPCRRCRPTAH